MHRPGEETKVHNGADDNASGTAVVLELAAALAGKTGGPPPAGDRGIQFPRRIERVRRIPPSRSGSAPSPRLQCSRLILQVVSVQAKMRVRGLGGAALLWLSFGRLLLALLILYLEEVAQR